jgi:hypothetical protein
MARLPAVVRRASPNLSTTSGPSLWHLTKRDLFRLQRAAHSGAERSRNDGYAERRSGAHCEKASRTTAGLGDITFSAR